MARYPGDELIPQPKIIDGRVCQKIDLRYLGVPVDPKLARKAFTAAGIRVHQTTYDIFWVEMSDYETAHLALNIARDREGALSRLSYLKFDVPLDAEKITLMEDLIQKIHGGLLK